MRGVVTPVMTRAPVRPWGEPFAPGAYTRALRFGEWIAEPVTPLFESWLLSAMEGGSTSSCGRRSASVPRGRTTSSSTAGTTTR